MWGRLDHRRRSMIDLSRIRPALNLRQWSRLPDSGTVMAKTLKTDWILFGTVVMMVLFGAVMVYSASSVVADIRMGSSYYFALRQLIWIAIALPLMMFFKQLHYRKLQTPAVAFTVMGLVMILLVIAYFADPRQ